jgi:sec-independent protein translocase protein TatA
MIGDLFDSPWKIAIIALLIIVLFGSKKLPDAARSLGKSMRILKTEVQGLHEDETDSTTTTVQTAPTVQSAPIPGQLPTATPTPADAHQAQIDALSKQLADLQQSVTVNKTADGAQAK